jgi:hypothetical protein
MNHGGGLVLPLNTYKLLAVSQMRKREGMLCPDDAEPKQSHFALPFNHQVPTKFFPSDCIKGILKSLVIILKPIFVKW